MRAYTVVLEYDPSVEVYGVYVPALPGCYSQGRTVEEAMVNAHEAISGHIATLEQIGAPVPEEGSAPPSDAVLALVEAGADARVLLGRVAA